MIGATCNEIDFEQKIWSVPPVAGRDQDQRRQRTAPHPAFATRALEILKSAARERTNNHYLFIGGKKGRGLSNMAMAELMKDMAFASTTPGRLAVPAHGCRSSQFKDGVAECTSYPN